MMNLLREALGHGLAAFRANLPGMIGVLILGGALLTAYAVSPDVHRWLDAFAVWKDGLGLIYPPVANLLVAGLLPVVLAMLLTHRFPRPRAWVVIALFWPERGLEVEALYRWLGWWLGTGTDATTVLIKMLIDMLGYTALWALPVYLLVMAWEQGERPFALLRTAAFWRERYLPGLLASWMLWTPGVLMIYSLPPGLQLPVQNLFLFIWVLIGSLIAKGRSTTAT